MQSQKKPGLANWKVMEMSFAFPKPFISRLGFLLFPCLLTFHQI
jgi:hypothetical protein